MPRRFARFDRASRTLLGVPPLKVLQGGCFDCQSSKLLPNAVLAQVSLGEGRSGRGVAGKDVFRKVLDARVAVGGSVDFSKAVKGLARPGRDGRGDVEGLGQLRNLPVMPTDDDRLARVFGVCLELLGEPGVVVVRVVLEDGQTQLLRQRREGFDGAVAVSGNGCGEEIDPVGSTR